ncbi:hypothetical protein G6F56_000542 [Rhizopus delemar]|nr:hypothetical protein G6F56_000542 [Rhizopus delemar]
MAEEEVDIYSDYDYGLGDDLEEIVHDVPFKKRSRPDNEDKDEKPLKSCKHNEEQKQAYQNHRHQPQHQQTPSSLTQLRGISNQPTNSIYLGELHWYTTEKDVREPLKKAHLIEYLKELTFFEYKMNGKSKGIVFLEFDNEDHASYAKEIYERTEFDHKRVYVLYTTAPNPFRHLPKESSSKATRNPTNNTSNIPRMGNTAMNFGFNPGMPYFPTPGVPPNMRMYNEMLMRGNMRSNSGRGRNGANFNQSNNTGNSMYINPAFFDQQQQ